MISNPTSCIRPTLPLCIYWHMLCCLSGWRGFEKSIHLVQKEGDNEASRSSFWHILDKAFSHSISAKIRLSFEAEEMIEAWKSGRDTYEVSDASTASQADEQHSAQKEELAGLMPQVIFILYVLEHP